MVEASMASFRLMAPREEDEEGRFLARPSFSVLDLALLNWF